MKKIFLYILTGSLCFSACKKDDDAATYVEPSDIAVQNAYDDQSIDKFLDANYLDTQGNIKAFSATDTADDHQTKLSAMIPAPVKLPSGVVYIVRNGAQPSPGKTIGATDITRTMMRAKTYLAANTDGNVAFISGSDMTPYNTIDGSGSPVIDPKFYYIDPLTDPLITKATTDAAKQPSYYVIEGYNEALQKFKAFDQVDGSPYNLQGVIIVPSRAAFARDAHYNYSGYSFRNRTFVFNFQVFKTTAR
ncbi:hypothetical protein [Chryseobacterium polytrichastri]|uniref:Uncharacterized protein n=1 Tax=Chryseobacterium polytrichastri TaxID=1302687 RepID=A0A1M6WDE1_9FLAO|nr:hypothetical protein [Chryseobacterium polytrichastri]SHK91485.1 hypothetical protein SAMN05444267_100964 [Chryseobacterium polytrichastri]